MYKTFATVLLLLTGVAASAAEPPKTDDEKAIYAVGVSVARSLAVFNLTPDELRLVQQGIADEFGGKKPDFDLQLYTPKIQELAKARRKALGARQVGAGQAFLEQAAKEKGALKTASGMVYQPLAEGKGDAPKASDVVKVNYRGTLVDGKEFDSSYKTGRPLEFKLENVIKCWVEGLQLMKPGGKAKMVCPPNLAYGDNGVGEKILPGATLAFEVELLEVNPKAAPKAAAAPAGIAVPSSAK